VPLDELVRESWIAEPLGGVEEEHRRFVELVGERSHFDRGVVVCDLFDCGDLRGQNKFVGYMLFPECDYSIYLTRTRGRARIAVGSNPWAPRPRRHDLATICERYGGGGHPFVGGIALDEDEGARARSIVDEIARELRA
jgi:hypothetical protein